ncbi:unnamed protein product [Rotaria magnacalcarata]|uniref:Uncharacterized protein n=1 Tax=Rotaria magnacalcarata TaxID=392030 RepID=A0A819S3I7_9BILA|nr:unnamed protein product [Rotaria magnacalcarata]
MLPQEDALSILVEFLHFHGYTKKWQKELVRRQDMTGEYYGRYIDDAFMTWNKSKNAWKQILQNANN